MVRSGTSRATVMNYATIVAAALQMAGCHDPSELEERYVEVRVFDAETSAPVPQTRVAITFVADTPRNCQHSFYPAPPTDDRGITVIPVGFHNCVGGPLLFRLECEPGSPEISVGLEEGASEINGPFGLEILTISPTSPTTVPALVARAVEADEGIRVEIEGYFFRFEVCDEDQGVVLLDGRSADFTPFAASLPAAASRVEADLCGNFELEEVFPRGLCTRATGGAPHRRFRIDVPDANLPGYPRGITTRFCTDENLTRLVACDGS